MMIPRLRMRGIFIVKGEKYNSDLHGRLLEPGASKRSFSTTTYRKIQGESTLLFVGFLA
jgi:hypothetical protein